MSQLNPNAAEFVPISPTRSIPSPACRTLINDDVISQSPRRANDIDINLPNPIEFENEVKSRPSEVDSYNGHNESDHNTSAELMENLLNGKNIDEIPEFQPGSTPSKIVPSEEFHFGPNAAPFTPAKFLDQSEAALSTKAVYGDESVATLNTSFNESSEEAPQETTTDLNVLNKESDPMSMSFYADKGDSTPFDLNEVHVLPDNIDEFLSKPDKVTFNDTISDLPEHFPLGEPEKTNLNVNNDDAIQITDLDKQSYDDEKELASPLESEKELIHTREECDFSKTPEPTNENLLTGEFCHIEKLRTPEVDSLPRDVELISPEPTSPRPQSSHSNISESKSPVPEATEVSDLLQTYPESLPRDVELISPEPSSRPDLSHEEIEKSEHFATEVEDLLKTESESHLPEALEVDDLLQRDVNPPVQEVEQVHNLPESKSPESDILEAKSPVCERPEVTSSASDLSESKSPVCDFGGTKSPVIDPPELASFVCELPAPGSLVCEFRAVKSPELERPESKSPVCELPASDSPVCELGGAKSPVSDLPESRSPVCELPVSKSPDPEVEAAVSPVCELPVSKSPVCELPVSKSPVCELFASQSPVPEIRDAKSPISDITEAKSPVPEILEEVCSLPRETVKEEDTSPIPPYEDDFTKTEIVEKAQLHFEAINNQVEEEIETRPLSAGFTSPEIIEKAEEHFNEFFKPQDTVSPQPKEETSPIKSPIGSTVIEDSFVADQSTLISDVAQDLAGAVQEVLIEAVSSPVPEEPVPETCPISPPKSIADTESVATTDVNSFLERSLPPEIASPLSPTEQIHESGQIIPDTLDLDHPLSKCVYPLTTGEQIDIKTENITPEFAEQTLVTPSEESKQEDVPTAPLLEEPVKEPVVEEKKIEEKQVEEQKEEVPIVEIAAAAGAVAAATAVVAAAATTPAKAEEKKKPATTPIRKTSATKTAAKPTAKATSASKTTASRLSTSPKTTPAKLSSTKLTTAAPKPPATKTAPRPKPTTAATKPADKKPLANGDVKSTVRSTLTARKTTAETTTAKTTSRLSAGAPKLSPTKTATTRSLAPKTAAAPRVSATRTTTITSTTSSTAPKSRPTTLTHRTTTSTTSATPKTSTTPKTPPTKTSPKTASAPKPRPPQTTTTLSKPRVPLTKTISKAPDTVKQNKESANKLTASKSVTSTTRATSATSRTASTTTVRKIESKTSGTRTMKTTTTTMKSTTAKKPAELVRHPPSKTKTTKVEKPKENGISTVVTEEITVVNNTTSSVIDSEPQLIKDNSPVDNKLITDNTLIQTNTAD